MSTHAAPSGRTSHAEKHTARRRALQPLWNALDKNLAPLLGGGAVLAVSGGPDSRALLEAVAQWDMRAAGPIVVASVDHGTRPESRAEADAVAARASVLGFDAKVLAVSAGRHDEATLREARMAALVDAAHVDERGCIVLAHHAGDVAEGMMHAFLGGGGEGVAMPGRGSWRVSGRRAVTVVRPFLELPRSALRVALGALGVRDVFVDPERVSARSVLRREALPAEGLAAQGLREALAVAAQRRRDDESVLGPLADALLVYRPDGTIEVAQAPAALQRRAVRRALVRLAPKQDVRSSSPAVALAVRMAGAGARGTVHLRSVVAEVEAGCIVCRPASLPLRPGASPDVKG